MKKNIYGYTINQLDEYFSSINESKYRSSQIFDWIYKKDLKDFSLMTNIKKDLIKIIKNEFVIDDLKVVTINESKDGTKKVLFKLSDGYLIETVLMIHNYGYSVCISSQVGCNMGCKFCASGLIKKKRDLKTHEMVLQIISINEIFNIKISSIVIMGIGEPMDNYNNVMDFIDIVNSNKGLNIGKRHITISTSGLVDKIDEFSKLQNGVNLAISFHSPFDDIRNMIMPINKKYNVDILIRSIKQYIERTKRRVTIEYILIDKINTTLKDMKELVKLFKGMNVYINLIRYNEVKENEFKRPSEEVVNFCYKYLKENGIDVTIRKELGFEIDASCGQLRNKYEQSTNT